MHSKSHFYPPTLFQKPIPLKNQILQQNIIIHFLIHSSMPAQPDTPIIQPVVPNPSIPNFYIIPSETNDSLNPYTIKISDNPVSVEVESPIAAEPTPPNSAGQFTAIHYAIGDSGPPDQRKPCTTRRNPQRIQARSDKDEYMFGAFDGYSMDSDSDDFELDKLLVLHDGKSTQNDYDDTGDVPYSLENPFMIKKSESMEIVNMDNDDDDVAVVENADGDTQDDGATDSDDLIAQLRESMDLLYSEMY